MLHKNKLIAKILLCVIIIQVIQPMVSISVFAETNAEQTTEEIGTEYEIKATEEWDVSKNGDRSVIAKWNRSDRSLTITGTGEMKSWDENSTRDWHKNKYTKAIKRASIGEGVTSIGEYAFDECSSLENITIPSSVTRIDSHAFSGGSSLKSIEIPSSVTSIGNYAFYGCSSLESIDIPNSVMTIRSSVFSGCSSLTSINVLTNNANYKSENGILFNKDKTRIIKYPGGKTDISEYQIPSSVTSIEDDTFNGCSSLVSIEIPNSVTSIGSKAFLGCDSLENIEIPSSVTSIRNSAFYSCNSLKNITIPSSVTSIENSAFNGCDSLESIEIPSSVTSIGKYAIPNVELSYVTQNSAGHKYVEENKQGYILKEQGSIESDIEVSTEYEIKATEEWDVSKNGDRSVIAKWNRSDRSLTITGTGEMKSWGYNFTEDWHRNQYTGLIKRVSIKEGVTSIGNYAFYRCSSLESITIPSSVTSIKSFTFEGCSSLKNIEIPSSVTSIDGYAFSGCSSLESITIPSTVTSIGNPAFYECSSLTSINVETNNANYKSENGILFNKDKTRIIKYPGGKTDISEYQIPSSVTSIGDDAFAGCSSLESIEITEGVTSIENGAFYGCSSLKSITIPEGVTNIESFIFYGCSSLESVEIPSSVTSIGDCAFRECSSLESITIPKGVTNIGKGTFSGCSSLKSITIPISVTSIGENATPSTALLYVTRNSAGHKYAEENKRGYIIVGYKGDVNQDGKIDTTDLTKILRHISAQNNGEIAQKHPSWILTGNEANAADINDNSKIDTTDLTKMLRHIAAQNNNEIAQNHPDWIIK